MEHIKWIDLTLIIIIKTYWNMTRQLTKKRLWQQRRFCVELRGIDTGTVYWNINSIKLIDGLLHFIGSINGWVMSVCSVVQFYASTLPLWSFCHLKMLLFWWAMVKYILFQIGLTYRQLWRVISTRPATENKPTINSARYSLMLPQLNDSKYK